MTGTFEVKFVITANTAEGWTVNVVAESKSMKKNMEIYERAITGEGCSSPVSSSHAINSYQPQQQRGNEAVS